MVKLRQARDSSGKTQQQVATEANMAVSSYRKLEAGGVRRPAATTIQGVSRSVGLDPHDIDEFREVLAGYEVVSGTQVAHQTAALAEPPVAAPVEVPPRRETPKVDMSELYEDGGLRAEIAALVERQQRLIDEQQEITKRLEMFGGQFAAQARFTEDN